MNQIEIKEKTVLKIFERRSDYVREVGVYNKLDGTGLAPKLMADCDGSIEVERIFGTNFEELIAKLFTNPAGFLAYTGRFFDWYREYRKFTNISLGEIDLSDLIVTADDRFVCYDFEHTRPGYIEDDVANFAAHVCFLGGGYTQLGLENAKIFVKCAWSKLDMNSERLVGSMRSALKRVCTEENIVPIPGADEYLATFVCCAFAHAPTRKATQIRNIIKALEQSNQYWTLFTNDVIGGSEKMLRYIMSAEKGSAAAVALTENFNIIDFPLMLKTDQACMILKEELASGSVLRDILMFRMRTKFLPVERMQ